jgi:protein-S-isoprenylcysteine O-methyltransferase Ste14
MTQIIVVLVNKLAVIFWIILASFQLGSSLVTGNLSRLLLTIQAGLIATFLLTRKQSIRNVNVAKQIFSWASVIAPLAIQTNSNHNIQSEILAIFGTLLSIWALKNLKGAFGISPADRGLVTKGPYKIIRHPMYTGELITLLGITFTNLSIWNLMISALTVGSIYQRIIWEEKIIKNYDQYSKKIPFRLIPKVW